MLSSFLKLCSAAAAGLACATAIAGGPGGAAAQVSGLSPQTDRIIVKYKDALAAGKGVARAAALPAGRSALVERAGQQFGMTLKALRTTATGAHVFKLDRKVTLGEAKALAAELMARDPMVAYAEPDSIAVATMTPNDPAYRAQWHYYEPVGGLDLPAAWDLSIGSGVVVAVVDSGYRPHVDLAGQILPGFDFISDPARANDGDGRDADASDPGDAVAASECGSGEPGKTSGWHGTHVAGTVAALTNNAVGVAGVAFGAKVVPARALGKCGGFTSDIADAIVWASGGAVPDAPLNANKAQVINMSLGGRSPCGQTYQDAIDSARSRGTVVVVAAGNDNDDAINYAPGNCAGVITVAAITRAGGRAPYSNFGPTVEVAAPGGYVGERAADGVLSTLNTGQVAPGADTYAFYQGTSMAAPHVAGVAALMLAANPDLTWDEVAARLELSARPFPADCAGCGIGVVDAFAAVGAAAVPSPDLFEVEPNDTPATANTVPTSGNTINGNVDSSTDFDFFAVQVPAAATLVATLKPNLASDYDLYLFDSVGTQVSFSNNGIGEVDSAWSSNTGTTSAVYYVLVVYYEGGAGPASGTYTLKLNW
jgi:serine protease